MSLNIAIQMDPIASINPKGDSTLRIGIEAQSRGHKLYYYTPDKLTCLSGHVVAHGHRIKLHADPAHYYNLGEAVRIDLAAMDVVLLRQDPPFNMPYITTTYLLDMLPKKTLVVNNPTSVRDLPEKLFPFLLAEFMPETLVSADIREIEAFLYQHKDIVLKPLHGYAGRGVLRFREGDDNFAAAMEMQLSASKEPLVAQRFLPEVKTGDRRIIFIDGKVGGVFGRIPAAHEIRANLRVGGTAVKAELTPRQKKMCDAMGPMLKERGLWFAGVDMIGDYLTEVNITSPTGLAQVTQLYNISLEAQLWDAIEGRLKSC